MQVEKLKIKYEEICIAYVEKFCKKQEMDFYGWVGDTVGGIAFCNDFFFDFQDIVLDINSFQKKGLIVDWYYGEMTEGINYYSYTKGLRISDLKN
jgi:hypothetical protein